jgi:hypothetical protein
MTRLSDERMEALLDAALRDDDPGAALPAGFAAAVAARAPARERFSVFESVVVPLLLAALAVPALTAAFAVLGPALTALGRAAPLSGGVRWELAAGAAAVTLLAALGDRLATALRHPPPGRSRHA